MSVKLTPPYKQYRDEERRKRAIKLREKLFNTIPAIFGLIVLALLFYLVGPVIALLILILAVLILILCFVVFSAKST